MSGVTRGVQSDADGRSIVALEPLRPAEFARRSLAAIEASEGRRRRRKRDTTPDKIGLDLKRELLYQTAAADPPPDGYEAFLLAQVLAARAAGPLRALAAELLDEYRLAALDPTYSRWLANGAPSDDAQDE